MSSESSATIENANRISDINISDSVVKSTNANAVDLLAGATAMVSANISQTSNNPTTTNNNDLIANNTSSAPTPTPTPTSNFSSATPTSTGVMTSTPPTTGLPAPLPIKTTSSIHSALRVVTNPGELTAAMPPMLGTGKWTPGPLRSPTSLLLSPMGFHGMRAMKSSGDTSDAMSSSLSSSFSNSSVSSSSLLEASKELQFDPRFLAEAWSQESPQSVYGPLGQTLLGFAGFAGFSPLAASSPGGARLLSPMAHLYHHPQASQSSSSSSSTSSSSSSSLHHQHHHQQQQHHHHQHLHPQSFTSHLQSPLMALSPPSSSGGSTSTSTTSGFYPPSVLIPASPHTLNPHLLSPLFATAISPSGGLGVSADMLSMIDPSTVFVPPNSPGAILRHLLPPALPTTSGGSGATPLNVKDLSLNELRPHFNKPMAVVAKELGVCITLMKKICRRNGLVRWPHRRIRSLVNRITSLQVIAGNSSGAEKKRFQSQIAVLREELSCVIENPNEKSRKAQADAKARSPTAANDSGAVGAFRGARGGNAGFASATSDDANGEEEEEDDEEEEENQEPEQEQENDEQDENVASQMFFVPAASPPIKKEPKRMADKAAPPRKSSSSSTSTTTTTRTSRSNSKAAAATRPPTSAAAAPLSSSASSTGKRKERVRGSFAPPPPIKIPRRSEYEMKRAIDDERPSSTTSTGSCGKRGSISSILC